MVVKWPCISFTWLCMASAFYIGWRWYHKTMQLFASSNRHLRKWAKVPWAPCDLIHCETQNPVGRKCVYKKVLGFPIRHSSQYQIPCPKPNSNQWLCPSAGCQAHSDDTLRSSPDNLFSIEPTRAWSKAASLRDTFGSFLFCGSPALTGNLAPIFLGTRITQQSKK